MSKKIDLTKQMLKQASEEVKSWPRWMREPTARGVYPPDPRYYTMLEELHNRVEKDGYVCSICGADDIDSMCLHNHVCPNLEEHRKNYDMDYLERCLLGEKKGPHRLP
jgi:hypothetical protein